MHHLLNLISNSSEEIQAILFSAILFLCWNIENIAGITFGYKKWPHASLNGKFVLTNMPLQFLLGFAYAKVLLYTSNHHFGLLFHLPHLNNKLVLFIASFILLDFGEFIYHLLM